jgi:hypothetical protein
MTGDDTVRLTYAELARCRGVSIGAAKRLAQRHRWLRQIGNDGLSRVSVPAPFVVNRDSVVDDVTADVAADVTGDVCGHTRNSAGMRLDEVVAAFTIIVRDVAADTYRDIAGDVILTLRDQVQTERDRADRAETQLQTERERADRAEVRAREAETRAADFQQQLQAEMVEHRRVVGTLTERIPPPRRSWWRRRSGR